MINLVKVVLPLVVIFVILLLVYLMGTSDDRRARREYKAQHKMAPDEKKELERLRFLHDALLDWSLDSMDVEPQARIVYDMIRENDKKELGR